LCYFSAHFGYRRNPSAIESPSFYRAVYMCGYLGPVANCLGVVSDLAVALMTVDRVDKMKNVARLSKTGRKVRELPSKW